MLRTGVDLRIKNLKSTSFGGRLVRLQIADIQRTAAMFLALSRKELAKTTCDHPRWRAPVAKGSRSPSACPSGSNGPASGDCRPTVRETVG